MRIASILWSAATLFSSFVNADTSTSLSSGNGTSQVLILTDDNFDATMTAHPLVLVKFYTPWCGYCQALAPEYEAAAGSLGDMADKVALAEIDCSVHEELCIDHDIGSFPTIKLFRNGMPTLYEGPRQSLAMTRYLLRQTQPAVTLFNQSDRHALDTLRQLDSIVVVGSGEASDGNAAYTTFKTLAEEWRDRYLFGWADHSNGDDRVVVYTRFDDQDDQVDVYPGNNMTVDSLKTFLRQHATPLFGPIGPDNFVDYEEAGLPLAYLFIDSTSMLASFRDLMMGFARARRGVINFVYIDATAYPEQADYLGINAEVSLWPAFVIQDPDYNRYVLDQTTPVNDATINGHINGFLDHALTPYLLSDPIPTNDGVVQIVVGSQFHDLVTRSDQDVLLKVYAPWCAHCKALAPVWEQLGQLVHDQAYPLRVASLDGTSNDIPVNDPAAFDIDAFPTIAFVEAYTHRVALYADNDDRSLASLVKFIHEQKAINTPATFLQLAIDGSPNEQLLTNLVEDNSATGDGDQDRISQVHDEL